MPRLESLEPRRLFVGEWTNTLNRFDVDDSGVVMPLDAVVLITKLNRDGAGPLSVPPVAPTAPPPFYDVAGNDDALSPLDAVAVIDVLNRDREGPTVNVRLRRDTAPGGTTNSDGLTSEPAFVGTVLNDPARPSGVDWLTAQVDGGAVVSVPFDRQGLFTFDPGLPLDGSADRQHTMRFQALDARGNLSSFFDVVFTLDTIAPNVPTLDLAPASDTEPVGDGATETAVVTLVGQTAPGMRVELTPGGASATADGEGQFTFTDVALVEGGNDFTVRAIDAAGNETSANRTLQRATSGTLAEDTRFIVESSQPVELGQVTGTRTLSFDVSATFDTSTRPPPSKTRFSSTLPTSSIRPIRAERCSTAAR